MTAVLIVEDNKDVASVVTQYISNGIPGAVICLAESCLQARSAFDEKVPDVLIVDVDLPDGDGFLLAREMRERFSGLKVIVTSGVEPSAMEIDASWSFLSKPYEPRDLIGLVRWLVSPRKCVPALATDARSEGTDEEPPKFDGHRLKNCLAGLMAGIRAFQADLTADAEDPTAVRNHSKDYGDRLCRMIVEAAKMIGTSGSNGRAIDG
ncbi:MAG: response regulator [Pseudomonadota bacterium]